MKVIDLQNIRQCNNGGKISSIKIEKSVMNNAQIHQLLHIIFILQS